LEALAAVIHEKQRNAAGTSEKVVHPWFNISQFLVRYDVYTG